MGDYVCKFNALELHSTGEANKKFKPVRIGTGYRLMNDDGQVLVGSNGNEYDFVTEGRADNFLMTNLARVKNMTGEVSVEYIQGLIKNYAENQFYWVLDEIESIKRLNDGEWQAVVDYGDCGHQVADYSWQRPAEWMPLPEIAEGEEKIVMLVRVSPDRTEFNIIEISAGAFIDWGDGETETVSAEGAIKHVYDYENPLLTDTEGSLGFKQALVTITPTEGVNLTKLIMGTDSTIAEAMPALLECEINAPNLTMVRFGGGFITCGLLERVKIAENNVSDWYRGFFNCDSLKVCDVNFASATSLFQTFYSVSSIVQINEINAPLAISIKQAFDKCGQLQKIKKLVIDSAKDLELAFNDCHKLKAVNSEEDKLIINLSVYPTNLKNTFNDTRAVIEIEINAPEAGGSKTDMFGCFSGSSVSNITILNTIQPNQLGSAFLATSNAHKWGEVNINGHAYCDRENAFNGSSIEKIPNWFSLTNGYRLSGCIRSSKIKELPALYFAGNRKVDYIFRSCEYLVSFGGMEVNGTYHSNASWFYGSYRNLESIGALDYSKLSEINLSNAVSLSKCDIYNINKNINFTNCNLSASELNKIFNNLLTVSGQTITIAGCPGVDDCDVSIATAKGWTVAV